jgi:hypothetical protein
MYNILKELRYMSDLKFLHKNPPKKKTIINYTDDLVEIRVKRKLHNLYFSCCS